MTLSHSLRSTLAVFVVFLSGSALTGCGDADDQAKDKAAPIRPVKTILVKPTITKFQRTYYAVVLASQEVDLSFRVSGRIVKLPIRNSQEVKKGDIVAQLDKRPFASKVTQMQSQLKQANAQLRVLTAGARKEDIAALKAGVAASKAELDARQKQFNRSSKLAKKGFVTRATLDKDRATLRVAKADLVAKRQELIKGQKGARKEEVDAQKAVIDGLTAQLKSLKDDLSDTSLRAPFDGIIAVRKVENFTNIQAKEAVATLQSQTTPNMSFNVPASDIPELARLAKLKQLDLNAKLDGFPDRVFVAKHNEFSTQADAATQTYRGRVSIEDAAGEPILPGMAGNVIITAKQTNKSALKVPLSSVASSADGSAFVWVIQIGDNKLAKRAITTGEVSGSTIAVTKGLKEGDIIATAGLSALQENMVVKPITAIGE